MTASTAGGLARERLRLLEAVRGGALILMVLYLVALARDPRPDGPPPRHAWRHLPAP
jgi:hypothetical protein